MLSSNAYSTLPPWTNAVHRICAAAGILLDGAPSNTLSEHEGPFLHAAACYAQLVNIARLATLPDADVVVNLCEAAAALRDDETHIPLADACDAVSVAAALWTLSSAAAAVATPLAAHISRWEEIDARRHVWGAGAARAWDLFEGGPIEWVQVSSALASRARGLLAAASPSTLSLSSSSAAAAVSAAAPAAGMSPSLLSPAEKAAVLARVRRVAVCTLGASERLRGALLLVRSRDELRVVVAGGCALLEQCLDCNYAIDADRSSALFLERSIGNCSPTSAAPAVGAQPPHSSSSSDGDDDSTFSPARRRQQQQRTLQTVTSSLARLPHLRASWECALAPLRGRSARQAAWWRWLLLVGICGSSAYTLISNREAVFSAAAEARSALDKFYVEHVAEPVSAIAGELLGPGALGGIGAVPLQVAEPHALAAAQANLSRMLSDFYPRLDRSSLSPELQREDLTALAAAGDMRPAFEAFAAEAPHAFRGAVAGHLTQSVLVQVEFLKKEVLSAMAALDTVMAQNRFNLQIMATVPALLVLYAGGVAVRSGASALASASSSLLLTSGGGGVEGDAAAAAATGLRLAMRDVLSVLVRSSKPEQQQQRLGDDTAVSMHQQPQRGDDNAVAVQEQQLLSIDSSERQQHQQRTVSRLGTAVDVLSLSSLELLLPGLNTLPSAGYANTHLRSVSATTASPSAHSPSAHSLSSALAECVRRASSAWEGVYARIYCVLSDVCVWVGFSRVHSAWGGLGWPATVTTASAAPASLPTHATVLSSVAPSEVTASQQSEATAPLAARASHAHSSASRTGHPTTTAAVVVKGSTYSSSTASSSTAITSSCSATPLLPLLLSRSFPNMTCEDIGTLSLSIRHISAILAGTSATATVAQRSTFNPRGLLFGGGAAAAGMSFSEASMLAYDLSLLASPELDVESRRRQLALLQSTYPPLSPALLALQCSSAAHGRCYSGGTPSVGAQARILALLSA